MSPWASVRNPAPPTPKGALSHKMHFVALFSFRGKTAGVSLHTSVAGPVNKMSKRLTFTFQPTRENGVFLRRTKKRRGAASRVLNTALSYYREHPDQFKLATATPKKRTV